MDKRPINPGASCSGCAFQKDFITDTNLCMHPLHVRHIQNTRRAENCTDYSEPGTPKTNEQNA